MVITVIARSVGSHIDGRERETERERENDRLWIIFVLLLLDGNAKHQISVENQFFR